MTWMLGTGVAAAMLMIGGGCSQNKADAAMADSGDDSLAALDAADAERRQLEMENAQLRRELDDLNARMGDQGPSTGFEGIEGVTSSYGNGEVTVSIANDILFDSGKNTLKTNAKSSLDQVASVISSQYGGKEIRIAGHTDSDPIKKSGWASNYHLGAERAYAVMDYLKSKGVPQSSMHIASYGPNKGMGTKEASRRVEIVVLVGS